MTQWQSTSAGRHLAGRSKRDTAPELALRSALHRLGLRFRVDVPIARGCRPDILMRPHGLAIFVDGCFWHGCPQHGRKTPFTGPNASLWHDKMLRNRERDERSSALAVAQGLMPLRVWECEVRANAGAVAEGVAALSVRAADQPPAGSAAG